MGSIDIKEVNYGVYGKCARISNGNIELVITIDLGPRIIRFGFAVGVNELLENYPGTQSLGDGREYKFRGGHRLWHSPEKLPRTYMPDDEPVEWEKLDGGIRVSQKTEPWVQIKKQMKIEITGENSVKITHSLINKNAWPVELSAWGITQGAPGGIEIIPQTKRETGFLPNRAVALWPYTKMNDRRIYWGSDFVAIKHDSDAKTPLKLGTTNENGWAAYFNHNNLFIKMFDYISGAKYPDYGMNFETYCCSAFTEIESLSPSVSIKPDDSITHIENWILERNINIVPNCEENMKQIKEKFIKKYLKPDLI